MNRLQIHYEEIVRPDLILKYNFQNIQQLPELFKIVIKMNLKEIIEEDKKYILPCMTALERITGQRATVTRAKKSIAAFHLKEGTIVGAKVTLTGNLMYQFLEKLTQLVLPKVKDFKCFKSESFDGSGNYSIGINDLMVFPEIESQYGRFPKNFGIDITFVIKNSNDEKSLLLLSGLQIPFKKENKKV